MSWRPGMPTQCRSCLGTDLEYRDDGSARCRSCGTVSPPAWAAAPPLPSGEAGAPSPAPAAPRTPSLPAPQAALHPAGGVYVPLLPRPQGPSAMAIVADTFVVFARRPVEFIVPWFLIHLGLFVGLDVVASSALDSLRGGLVPADPSSALPTAGVALGLFVLLLLLYLLGSSVAGGALSHIAVHIHRGGKGRIEDSLWSALAHLPTILGATIFLSFIYLLGFGLALLPLSLGTILNNPALVFLGFLSFVIMLPVSVYLAVSWSMYLPAIVLEGRGIKDSLSRSWELAHRKRWSLLGAFLLVGLFSVGIVIGIGFALLLARDPVLALVGLALIYAMSSSFSVIAPAIAYDFLASPARFGAAAGIRPPSRPAAPRPLR